MTLLRLRPHYTPESPPLLSFFIPATPDGPEAKARSTSASLASRQTPDWELEALAISVSGNAPLSIRGLSCNVESCMVVLESERLLFREHEPSDLDTYCAMEAHLEVRRYVGGFPS